MGLGKKFLIAIFNVIACYMQEMIQLGKIVIQNFAFLAPLT